MGNWNAMPPPDGLKCPHCGDDRQMEQLNSVWWHCDGCARKWPVVTTRPFVKDEPRVP